MKKYLKIAIVRTVTFTDLCNCNNGISAMPYCLLSMFVCVKSPEKFGRFGITYVSNREL